MDLIRNFASYNHTGFHLMGHGWILEILEDLEAYALANDLPGIAGKAAEALKTARAEIRTKGDHTRNDKEDRHRP